MQYTTLGNTGLRVSRLCLGTMTFGWSADEATAHSILDYALDAGINFLDTAEIYSAWIDGNSGGESETIIGSWLANQPRERVKIATKVRGSDLSHDAILRHAEDSLQRLGTDYIDLYQTHWFDADTPLEETLDALQTLIDTGKVRHIGCSNYPAWRLTKANWIAERMNISRYDSIQPHYSIFHRNEFERELADACLDLDIAVIPYSPLAGGFATGKYTREDHDPDTTRKNSSIVQDLIDNDQAYDALDVMRTIADAHDTNTAQIALAWLLHQPAVSAPIVGARTVDQLANVIDAVDIELSDDEIQTLNDATDGF